MDKTVSLFCFGVVLILLVNAITWGVNFSSHRPTQNLVPPKDLKYFTLGFNEVVADSLWIRFLQDVDLCQDGLTARERQESFNSRFEAPQGELGESQIQALSESSNRLPKCQKGWAYSMLDSVSELAPKFYLPYSFGGGILSILAEDREGAALIYEKGLQVFPEDWNLHYKLAYHYLYELGQPEPAAAHMRKAALYGAPAWVYALAGRLYSEAGQLELGIHTLREALKTDVSRLAGSKQRIQERLEQLEQKKAELERQSSAL